MLERASNLGQSVVHEGVNNILSKGPSCKLVSLECFRCAMNRNPPPETNHGQTLDLSTMLSECFEIINNTARNNLNRGQDNQREWDQRYPRWKRLLEKGDAKTIWSAIDWKGKVSEGTIERPQDDQFKAHFEELLSPSVSEEERIQISARCPILPSWITHLQLMK